MNKKGSLIISLDYELMWGCCPWTTPDLYGRSNVAQVPLVIDRMLKLFEQYDIHATFATVGMIMLNGKEDAINNAPSLQPSYLDKVQSPYENSHLERIEDRNLSLYFSPESIEQLKMAKGIEIGTHTYCHYFCWEKGQTIEEFEADIQKAIIVAKSKSLELKSIVFPKNMVSDNYLEVCSKYGMTSYRGNALKYFQSPRNKYEEIKNRVCRLVDAYINIGGYMSIPYSSLERRNGMLNICASRMLRPYSPKLSFLEKLRFRRIKEEMYYAAKNGEMYHLWWHPHNFGADMEENFKMLENICNTYKQLNADYGFKSLNMSEFKTFIEHEK